MEQYEGRWKDLEMLRLGNLSGTCNPLPNSEGVLSDSQMRSDTCQPPPRYEVLSYSPPPESWRAYARELDPEWDLRLPSKPKEGVKRVTKQHRFRPKATDAGSSKGENH